MFYDYLGICSGCERAAHIDDLVRCSRCEENYHECCTEWTEIKDGWLCNDCVEDIESGGDPEWEAILKNAS